MYYVATTEYTANVSRCCMFQCGLRNKLNFVPEYYGINKKQKNHKYSTSEIKFIE